MNKPLHRLAMTLAATYLLAVALVVFWPTPVDRQGAGTLREMLSWLHSHGLPAFINYNVVEFCANIVMFVPMGVLASAYFKKARVGIVIGALGSCLIELAQALFLPERYASGLDILANTMGAAVGAILYFLLAPRWGNLLQTTRREFLEHPDSHPLAYTTPEWPR